MASSKKYVKINPRLRMLKKHTLLDRVTVITQQPTEVTAAQLKEVLEFKVNGHPVAVEVPASEAKDTDVESADNAEG